MNSIRLAIYLLSAINVGLFIFLAYLALKGWRKNITNRYYFTLLVSIIVWLLIINVEGLHGNNTLFSRFDFFFVSSVCFCFSLFARSYIPIRRRNRIVQYISFVVYAILIFLSFSHVVFTRVNTSGPYEISKPLYAFYILLLTFLAIGVGGITLYKQWKKSEGILRRQLGYVLFGFTLPTVILLVISAYNVFVKHVSDDFYSFVTNIGIIFALLCTNAIFRYRFLDIRVVLQRSIVRIVSFLALLLVYLLLILVLRDTLISETKELNPTSLVVVGLLIILTVEPLRKYIYNFVDKRFELHDRQQERIQQQLQIVLKSQRSLADLEQAIRKAFQETASVDTVDYVDADDQKLIGKPALRAYLQSTGKIVICEEMPYRLDEDARFKQVNDEVKGGLATAYVPIGQNEIFVGSFMLGPRKGKVAYSAQEVSAIKLLQSQATDAFLNARLYKQAVERIRV
jgi:hypothetical protein